MKAECVKCTPHKVIASMLGRSTTSVGTKVNKLHIKTNYPNDSNHKAEYQDYDWCYKRYVELGMSHDEMAKEAGVKTRTIQKWCSEIHKLNMFTIKNYLRINDTQHDLIIGSLLGDGHIDKRPNAPLFIVSHAENQKDYLYWKYDILKNLCNSPPSLIKGKKNVDICGSICDTRDAYRISTRIVSELSHYRALSKREVIDKLNDFSLCVYALDDWYRSKSNWQPCFAGIDLCDRYYLIERLRNDFDIDCKLSNSDNRYGSINHIDSKKLDALILSNIPNELDVVIDKVLSVYDGGKVVNA